VNRPRASASERGLGPLQTWLFERVTRPEASVCLEERAAEVEAQARVVVGGLLSAGDRIEIYRNGYWSRLVECLRDDYPAVAHALGAPAFRALCLAFIEAHPPRSASLNFYGAPFAAYCAARPGAELGFAAELARLEWAVVEAIHADADRLIGPASFSARGARELDLERACLEPSPALRVLSMSHPAHVYYQAFLDGEDPSPPGAEPSHVAVCRRGDDVWRIPLEAPLVRVLGLLIGGAPLGQALSALPDVAPERLAVRAAELRRAFAEWVACGFFAAVTPGVTRAGPT
jgi:hypothetical protein